MNNIVCLSYVCVHYIPYSIPQHKVPLHMNVLSYCVSECTITNRAYMVLTEVVRETTLSNLVF